MAVAATGFFDGVHLGHRQVISALVRTARERGEESLVVTFSQHPRAVLQQDPLKLRLLTSRQEKEDMLKSLGVDRVEVVPFTRDFAALTAGGYVREILVSRFGTDAIVMGYDNRLGSDSLSPSEISGIANDCGVDVVVVPALSDGSSEVSSTRIRSMLDDGRVRGASSMLGYHYTLHGVVVQGKQLGRTIGFPTANLRVSDPLKQIPARGVYATRTEVMGRKYLSMTNVGDIVETNIFGFDEDIYSLEMNVSFLDRIRDMKDFASLEELSVQLAVDKQYVMQSMQ